MANERLRAAMSEAGIEPEQLADIAEVDVKTVQRWLAGRLPYTRKRVVVAKALGKAESDIWPETAPQPTPARRLTDLHGAFAYPDDEGVPDWPQLMQEASYTIELCDYSLIDVVDTPGALQFLKAKAAAGAHVRVMIASLRSLWLTLNDWPPDVSRGFATESPLIQAIKEAHKQLAPLSAHTKIEARQVLTPRSPLIRRFDDQMLVALPVWGAKRPGAPLLHLHHNQHDGLFERFTAHFDALWRTSWELEPPSEPPLPYAPTHSGRSDTPKRQAKLTPFGRRTARRS